jgi:hypothetical protein
MARYLVKTIPQWELPSWVDELRHGRKFLPVRAAQHYTHAIVLHKGRALVMKVKARSGSNPTEWCGPKATEPVRATRRLYFDPRSVRVYPAAVAGFQGIRYTTQPGLFAVGAM